MSLSGMGNSSFQEEMNRGHAHIPPWVLDKATELQRRILRCRKASTLNHVKACLSDSMSTTLKAAFFNHTHIKPNKSIALSEALNCMIDDYGKPVDD